MRMHNEDYIYKLYMNIYLYFFFDNKKFFLNYIPLLLEKCLRDLREKTYLVEQ